MLSELEGKVRELELYFFILGVEYMSDVMALEPLSNNCSNGGNNLV